VRYRARQADSAVRRAAACPWSSGHGVGEGAAGAATGTTPSVFAGGAGGAGGAGAPPPAVTPPAWPVARALRSEAVDDEDGPGSDPTITGFPSHCGGQRTSAYCGWFWWPAPAMVWPSGPVSSGLENASALGELSRWALASGKWLSTAPVLKLGKALEPAWTWTAIELTVPL